MKVPVLLPNIFNHPFTYETNIKLQKGDYVKVPFGKSKLTGLIWDKFEDRNKKKYKVKKIISKLDVKTLSPKTIKFFNSFSDYNLVPKGMAIKLHLLSGEAIEKFENKQFDIFNNILTKKKFILDINQTKALKEISANDKNFRVHLLQGATGSGKTMVYFSHLKIKIDRGFQCLILLPEIGLTQEFEKKFEEFFGFKAAVWHSDISKKKKKIIWSGLSQGKIKVIIGARSSLFLPFKNLGIIIVDEEHDQSYKQDEGVTYNARDMAISRAHSENIPINLVTAVPSLETFENVKKKKYSISRLINRYKKAKLPNCEIIDLKKFKLYNQSWISSKTYEKVNKHLLNGDQVLFFLNRRGFSPFVFCNKCFNIFSCPNCSINLVYHKHKKKLLCHYCGYSTPLFRNCEKGNICEFKFSGPGVERIYEEVKTLFPKYKSLIFSSDTINKKSSKKDLENIIDNNINILVGTQLISKGYHFPYLNCIVVLDIDLTFQGHDLRAAEKNLQLYHQLSGRAGRTGKDSMIYFQTYNLDQKIV